MSHSARPNQQGFTLLELLIVIVVIGILALLIIPNLTSAPKKARDTQRKTDVRAIQKALEEYFVSNSAYPIATGTADTVLGSASPNDALTGGATPILKTVPTDPKAGTATPYKYTSTDGQTYKVDACLEDQAASGQSITAGTTYGAGCSTKTFELANNN